jgi:hypothetical protein
VIAITTDAKRCACASQGSISSIEQRVVQKSAGRAELAAGHRHGATRGGEIGENQFDFVFDWHGRDDRRLRAATSGRT